MVFFMSHAQLDFIFSYFFENGNTKPVPYLNVFLVWSLTMTFKLNARDVHGSHSPWRYLWLRPGRADDVSYHLPARLYSTFLSGATKCTVDKRTLCHLYHRDVVREQLERENTGMMQQSQNTKTERGNSTVNKNDA